jgi:hypothetical protein
MAPRRQNVIRLGSSGGIGMEYYCYANCYSLGGI